MVEINSLKHNQGISELQELDLLQYRGNLPHKNVV